MISFCFFKVKFIRLFYIIPFLFFLHIPFAHAQTILFLGDSITIGKGVLEKQAYPSLVKTQLIKKFPSLHIINASRSGSTSASAVSRFTWLTQKQKVDILFLALGANDGLRALPVSSIENNLSRVIQAAQKKHILVVLAGMYMLPNYGQKYTKAFASVFPKLAHKYNLILIPFLLDKVAGEKKYNQEDGIHPNVQGHKIIAKTVFPYIQTALSRLKK